MTTPPRRMKLTDLNPRWVGTGSVIVGLTFDCPHCRIQRLGVLFRNAIDPERWLDKGVTRFHASNEWERVGDSFETLSLNPSIDTTISFEKHWHGHIQNGEVI